MNRDYCLIIPCRDEAQFARRTLDSLVEQTIQPRCVVIVDDGSSDETPSILREYSLKHDFIRVVSRQNSGARRVGPGVIDAFYEGYQTINPNEFQYICKMDLDLDLPRDYFARLIDRMEKDPRIGTCSGKPYFPDRTNTEKSFDGKLVSEACGDEMSVGMIKFYRRECFEEIGGFVREVMWDGIDCHRCRMLGWVACSWDDPELRFIHLRPMGSSQSGILTGRMRHGFGQWFMGTSPTYMMASAVFRMTRRPYVIGGCAMLAGYFKSMIRGQQRYGDDDFRQFLRQYQWSCLVNGKSQSTSRLNRRTEGVWETLHPGEKLRSDFGSPLSSPMMHAKKGQLQFQNDSE